INEFEQKYRQNPAGKLSVKPVDQIFEKPDLQAAVLEYPGKMPVPIEPLADLAGKVPLPDDHQNKKRNYHDDRHDQHVDRKSPPGIEVENAYEGKRSEY